MEKEFKTKVTVKIDDKNETAIYRFFLPYARF